MKNNLIDLFNINTKDELIKEIIKKADESNDSYFHKDINSETKLYAFFADPARHSLSPQMYNRAFRELEMNSYYFASTIPQGRIREAMRKVRELGIHGLNISMPHKSSVIDELDEIDSIAKLCEAVNTIRTVDDEDHNNSILPVLKGYNTDAYGAVRALKDLGCEIKDKNGVLLGLGGAGKAVLSGLANEGIKQVSIFVRKIRPKEHSRYATKITNAFPGLKVRISSLGDTKDLRVRIEESELLVNCTNVGMGDYEEMSLIPDESFLNKNLKVMDVIYSPEKTKLLRQAEKAGCANANGLKMLLYQGEEAFRLYTGYNHKLSVDKI